MLRLSPAADAAARRSLPLRHGASPLAFAAAGALLFAAGAAATILCHASMSAASAEPPPGTTLPDGWVAMCGRSPPRDAAMFLGMWLSMTLAMMLPSFAPALWRWRASSAAGAVTPSDGAVAMVALGYFAAWSAVGLVAFAASLAAAVALREAGVAQVFPIVGGAVVASAGALQFSAWKARHLDACRGWAARGRGAASLAAAWRHGWRLGRHCAASCAGWTAALLAGGAMDLRAMALVTIAITAERLAADGESAARIGGAIAIGLGLARLASATVLAWR